MAKQKFIQRPKESEAVITKRWTKKRDSIETLANNVQSLRYNISLGLKNESKNEKNFLTCLVIALILKTGERIGNSVSESKGHVGITGLKKDQVTIIGNKIILEYVGKSGVEHEKMFSDEKIAKALKIAKKNSPDKNIFTTSKGFKIKNVRINKFLSDFSISAKDIRGYSSNNLLIRKLKDLEPEDTEIKRKKQFNKAARFVAKKIGHGLATMKKHYMLPELEPSFVEKGIVIDIDDVSKYNDGGTIKSNEIKVSKSADKFTCKDAIPDSKLKKSLPNEVKEILKEKYHLKKGGDISFDNFHLNTEANYSSISEKEIPNREPDFISESGSKYWYDGEYVIRKSDHWGELGECTWMLDSKSYMGLNQGKCLLSDFKKQNIEMKDGGDIKELGNDILPIGTIIYVNEFRSNHVYEVVGFIGERDGIGRQYDAYELKADMSGVKGKKTKITFPYPNTKTKFRYHATLPKEGSKLISQSEIDSEKRRGSESEVVINWEGDKPSYLMTKDEYKSIVTPKIKEFNKFIEKNKEYFSRIEYNGFDYLDFNSFKNIHKPSQYSNVERDFLRGKGFPSEYQPKQASEELIEKLNSYKDILASIFGLENLKKIEPDETTSNKRSIRRAIDSGAYEKLLREGKINYTFLKNVFDSAGVNIPTKLEKIESEVVEKGLTSEVKKKFENSTEQFLIDLKNIFEKEIKFYADLYVSWYLNSVRRMYDFCRINEAFTNYDSFAKSYSLSNGFEPIPILKKTNSTNLIIGYDYHPDIKKVLSLNVILYNSSINQNYVKYQVKDNWKEILDEKSLSYANSLFDDFGKRILDEIVEINNIDNDIPEIKDAEIFDLTQKGFEAKFNLVYSNGFVFSVETQVIYAGGYNIQALHLRGLFKFKYEGKFVSKKEILEAYNTLNSDEKTFENGGLIINEISIPENIDALLKEKYSLDNDVSFHSDEWNKIIGKKGDMGLVPDEVRKSDEYIRLKTKYKLSFKKFQDFNQSDKNKAILDFTKKLDRVTQQKIRHYYLEETSKLKKGGSLNTYAVCTTSIGKTEGTQKRSDWSDEGLDKYESCVLRVKAKMSNGGELKLDKKKVYEGDKIIRDMPLSEVEKYIGIYHEQEGNILFAKNRFLIWFYDTTDFATKINSGEYDFLMFPNRMKGFSFNSVGIIDEIWTSKWQNKFKGAKNLLGMVQGYYDEANNKIVIHFMSVRPSAKRNHINSFMIQYAKKVFNSNDVVFHEPTEQGQSFIDSNNFEQGGGVSFDKVISASSRFRPTETVVFDPPLEGKNGAKLISYTWSYEWTMKPNYEGELVSKRVSDWSQAEISAETGRDIVHQYTVLMPDGEYKTVSSDSVPVLLGYIDRKEFKSFPNLVTASKTLAKQQMQLAILEAQKKEYDELYTKFEKAEKPEIKEVGETSKFSAAIESWNKGAYSNYAMGDIIHRQDNDYIYETKEYKKRPLSKDTIEQLTSFWISERVKEAGGINPRGLYDLKNRVSRQKRKVENILGVKMENGGGIEDFDWESLYNPSPEEQKIRDDEHKKSLEQEKEDWYKNTKFSKKWAATYKDAVNRTVKEYLDAKSTFDDWASRQYKQNKGMVFLGGDDVFGEAKSIGSINEGRRQRVLRGSKMQMDESIETLRELRLSESEINDLILNYKMENGGAINENIYEHLYYKGYSKEYVDSIISLILSDKVKSDIDRIEALGNMSEFKDAHKLCLDLYKYLSEQSPLENGSWGKEHHNSIDKIRQALSSLAYVFHEGGKFIIEYDRNNKFKLLDEPIVRNWTEYIYDLKLRVNEYSGKNVFYLNELKFENGGDFSDFDQYYYEEAYRDRSEGTVIRQVYDSGILKSNERYIFSSEKEIKFREEKQEQGETSKPEGLWYSIGNEWAEEVSTQLDFLANRYNYVHKIKITDKVLSINTIDEAIDFTKKYGIKERSSYMNRFLIKWVDVAEDYSGIEVKEPALWCRIDDVYLRIEDGNEKSYDLRDLFWWMYSWDVASGCIWKEDGVESIELFDWEKEIMDSYGQFENGGYLGSLLYGEIEKKNQQEKANELRSALLKEGFFVNQPNTSITDFGVSTYISFIDEFNVYRKFRISDHPVTNHERISNEYHYSQNTDVNKLVESVKRDIEETRKNNLIRIDLESKDKERTLLANEKWERIKVDFEGLCFKKNDRTYQDLTKFSENKNRSNIYQKALDNNRYGETAYYYEWTEPKNSNEYCSEKPSREFIENYEENIKMLKGGYLEKEEKDDIYKDWKELINMSYSELKEFYDSEEGKVAGLKKSEADELGIHSGRESARWIMKMKKTKREDWTNEMWAWAKRQIGFVKRMSGAKGDLIDEKGNKTRKYLSLLIWGHNPKKSNNEKKMFGGIIGSKKLNYSGRVFVGKDNNWRFEFSDHKAKLLIDINDILDKKINNIPLIHFIQHRELFKAYPELRYINVVFKSKDDYFTDNPKMYDFKGEFNIFVFSLAYNKTTDLDKQILIYIDYERANKITSTEMYNMVLRGTITEVQHAIQQAEGFGEERGLSYFVEKEQRKYARVLKEVWGKITSLPEKSIERIQAEADFNIRLKEIRENARLLYENQLLEIESIESANRIKLNKSQRDSNPSEIEKQ